MRKPVLLSVLLGVALIAGCASTGPGDEPPLPTEEEKKSNSLGSKLKDATGQTDRRNYQFEVHAPEALTEQIRSQTYVGRWQKREDYKSYQFAGLAGQLSKEVDAILRANGYFNGSSKVSTTDRRIVVDVQAGPRTTVNAFDLSIVGPAKDDKLVLAFATGQWQLPAGSFFQSSAWQSSKRNLVEALHQQGYLRARIADSNARVDPELTAASLKVVVDSGERLQFGELEVKGLERYDQSVIDDLRPFKVGDPYTLDVLLLYQARLRSSGFFDNVVVLPRLDLVEQESSLIQVPLKVELSERQTKRAAVGFGYSTDEGPRGQLGLQHRNLFGQNWQLESALIVSAVKQQAFANVRTPYDAKGYFKGFGGRLEREDVEGLVSTSSNTYIGRGRRSGSTETFLSLAYQTEQQRIKAGSDADGRTFSQSALVLGYSWNLRRLDSTLDPRKGYTISAQISGAHESAFSDQSFARLYTRAIRFQPMPRDSMFEDGTLLLMGEIGIVSADSREGIPSENLFRTGGAQTIRGYSYRSLGVIDAGATVGGRYELLGSIEYQHRMSDLYSLATFFDYGNAADTRDDYKPVAGYGIGARLRTPIGPVNLDLAYGHHANRLRLHFSVGYTF